MPRQSVIASRERHEALSYAVKERLGQLGLHQSTAVQLADISSKTWQRVMAGTGHPDPITLGKIDRALELPRGSCRRLLEDGDPFPAVPTERPAPAPTPPGDPWELVAQLERRIARLERGQNLPHRELGGE